MKNTILTIANGIPMAVLILLYKFRLDMTVYIILLWVLLAVINTLLIHKIWPLLKMNIFLMFTSTVGVYVNNQIFYSFVYLDSAAKNNVWYEITDVLGFFCILIVLSIVLRISLIFIKRHLRRLKDKKYRIIKIGEDAIYELIYDHFIQNREKYCHISEDNTLCGFSIDWENRSFIFAVKEIEDPSSKFNFDLDSLHGILPDTAKSVFSDNLYKDYYEKELRQML